MHCCFCGQVRHSTEGPQQVIGFESGGVCLIAALCPKGVKRYMQSSIPIGCCAVNARVSPISSSQLDEAPASPHHVFARSRSATVPTLWPFTACIAVDREGLSVGSLRVSRQYAHRLQRPPAWSLPSCTEDGVRR